MKYIKYNPNPRNHNTGDCVIRAIAKVTNDDWDSAFIMATSQAFEMKKMPDRNEVWNEVLYDLGFKRRTAPDTCPICYTVKDFCKDHPEGTYVVATGNHVLTVIDGDYYDSWDSGNQVVAYYYTKEV